MNRTFGDDWISSIPILGCSFHHTSTFLDRKTDTFQENKSHKNRGVTANLLLCIRCAFIPTLFKGFKSLPLLPLHLLFWLSITIQSCTFQKDFNKRINSNVWFYNFFTSYGSKINASMFPFLFFHASCTCFLYAPIFFPFSIQISFQSIIFLFPLCSYK